MSFKANEDYKALLLDAICFKSLTQLHEGILQKQSQGRRFLDIEPLHKLSTEVLYVF